ncbi:Hypothetical predicted protein [Marmota monax]|uniref:Uncharacterized protein n=1 Tax=Marmota monax TaxID=9995 RepID=A0A5E4CEI1_MARMO|nr:hypothetical protein GHT09_001978 [Marmota monax]VTJ79549.1 Hypothetical predicted protein [Marmota monax]
MWNRCESAICIRGLRRGIQGRKNLEGVQTSWRKVCFSLGMAEEFAGLACLSWWVLLDTMQCCGEQTVEQRISSQCHACTVGTQVLSRCAGGSVCDLPYTVACMFHRVLVTTWNTQRKGSHPVKAANSQNVHVLGL